MSQQELDDALAAGDRTVVPYSQRVADGEDANVLLGELQPLAFLLGYADVAEMLETIERARIASQN